MGEELLDSIAKDFSEKHLVLKKKKRTNGSFVSYHDIKYRVNSKF